MATAECVKVIVRCRPMNAREKDLKCDCVIQMEGTRAQCAIKNPHDEKAPPKSFTFDGAYFVDSTTENIYNEIAYPLVEVSLKDLSLIQTLIFVLPGLPMVLSIKLDDYTCIAKKITFKAL